MAMPTKEQWAAVEAELSSVFGSVEFRADGYTVRALVKPISPLKCGIAIYIDGWLRGEWVNGEAPEARKFLQEKKRYLHSAKAREEAKKQLRKRLPGELKQLWRDTAEATISYWWPYWTSPKAMTRQWRETCTSIEIIKVGP